MSLLFLLAAVAAAFAGWRIWRRLRFFLHVFQLEGYNPRQYTHWLRLRVRTVIVRTSHLLAAATLLLAWAIGVWGSPFWAALVALMAWPILFASSRIYRSDRQKKPLKYTPRLRRLLALSALLGMVLVSAGLAAGLSTAGAGGFLWFLVGLFLVDLGAPFLILLTALLLAPAESAVQSGFKARARRTLAHHPNLTIIGITGSYGKTSVKFIIAAILRRRYNVLATPGSFNTPMGICLVINERLRPEHQMLVLEMGARYAGDIRELCEIARPHVVVVTSVGFAHLESMGSVEAIEREKGSLVSCAADGAVTVLNGDDPRVFRMRERARGPVWTTSTAGENATITAREVRYDAMGASFVVQDETGQAMTFRTRLLGDHNVGNVLLGVAVGRAMGLRLRQIARAVEELKPVEHRLELKREGHLTIIDDAFNSNPVGARSAVEVLGQFNSGKRIIITPGMIELGTRQEEENRLLGRHIAKHADLAILVGSEQTRPIQEGLKESAYPDENVRVVSSLFEARDILRQVARPGDVVLFENDLPDQYS